MTTLYDAHVHMALTGFDYRSALAQHVPAPDDEAIRRTLAAYQAAGVRYVRDGGDKYDAGLRAAQLARDFDIAYASPAFPIHQKGNYGAFIGRGFQTLADFRSLVDEALASGATFIKVMASGILDFTTFGRLTGHGLDAGLLASMVAYARRKGVPVMVHVNGSDTVAAAIRAGADSVEHAYYLNDATLRLLAESDCIWVPTLAPIHNARACGLGDARTLQAIEETQTQAVRTVAALGGTIACGSDAGAGGVEHVQGAADERSLLEEALGEAADEVLGTGLSALQARFPA